jgi:GR25 family glycosyltransferase involved in LPS biosynthesis
MNTGIPLYVINLEKDADRWESVLEETEDSFFNTFRVDAINARDLPDPDFVSSGVRAAWLSHLKAMRDFLESDADFALIAEDDFHISSLDELASHLENLKAFNWDMVQFGFLKPGIDTKIKILIADTENLIFRLLGRLSRLPLLSSKSFSSRMRVKQSLETPLGFVVDDCQPGAHFYLVRRSFCRSISKLNDPQFLSIDDFYMSLSRMRTFTMLRVKRNVAIQKPFSPWDGPRFKRSL